MPFVHAAVTLDHHTAHITRFDADRSEVATVKAQSHNTPQHNSAVRDVHEFFHNVCVALDRMDAVLVIGSRTSISDFRHYVEKHYATLAPRILGYEVHDVMTPGQTVAFARNYFDRHTRLAH